MKRHNLQPPFRESSDSLRQQAASTNLPMPSTPASGNGVYALALGAICFLIVMVVEGREVGWWEFLARLIEDLAAGGGGGGILRVAARASLALHPAEDCPSPESESRC